MLSALNGYLTAVVILLLQVTPSVQGLLHPHSVAQESHLRTVRAP